MRVALYKGKTRIFNILTSWWLGGEYSHCELIFKDNVAASSSFLDGGVRFKQITFTPDHWDIFEVGGDEDKARAWFQERQDAKYDVLGLIGFLVRPIEGKKNRYVCSEAVMEALGYKEGWRFDPCIMRPVLERLSG